MNTCIHEIVRRSGWLPAVLGAFAFAGMVRADVKVVATVSITGQSAPPPGQFPDGPKPPHFPQKVTTYYKGSLARVEIADGPVTITDSASGMGYRLDPSRKTYFMFSPRGNGFRQRPGGEPPMDGGGDAESHRENEGHCRPDRTGIYDLQRVSRRTRLAHSERRRVWRAGRPAAGATAIQAADQRRNLAIGHCSDDRQRDGRSAYPQRGPGGEVSGGCTGTDEAAASGRQDQHDTPWPAAVGPKESACADIAKTVTTMTVISVSQAALSDALFRLPPGYTEVSPPRREQMGPPPDGRGPRRQEGFGGPPPGGGGPMGPPPPPGGEWR